MKLSEKLILVDCDGVLLDWEYSFDFWMKEHGYTKHYSGDYELEKCYDIDRAEMKALIRQFNESAWMRSLPPLRDSVKYVRKLHDELGYVFHCITSLSKDEYAQQLRVENLETVFGKGIFEKVICLDTGADKDEALAEYKDTGCIWIEDKIQNALVGLEAGLDSVLIEHPHNKDFEHENILKIKNWKELYESLV